MNACIERAYAKIDLDAFKFNVNSILKAVKNDTKMIAVLKTDGYGHGAYELARCLDDNDRVWGYALATSDEAFLLRQEGIKKNMLILGYTFSSSYKRMIKEGISFAVFKSSMLKDIAQAVNELRAESGSDIKAHIHIKVDTGMGRIGVTPDAEGLSIVKEAAEYEEIVIEGIFTHMARADESDLTSALTQVSVFKDFTEKVENELGINIEFKHISNSAGIIELPQANMDLVRAGIILYGLWPSNEVSKNKVELKPILSLYARIVHIKDIGIGTPISYGGTFVSDYPMKVATISIGYGDGYPRGLSNKGYVLIRGIKCPILGRVCMDQMMVDVSDVSGVEEGDWVTLIGTDGEETITMEELGDISGRFNYELACDIGKRIPRVYN